MSVIPKPASTVVLVDSLSRVYMTKRPVMMKFLGGFYVFPGGAVEEEDYQIKNGRIFNEGDNQEINEAFYVAAVRETFEEVGILLCKNREGFSAQIPLEQQINYRKSLLNRELTFAEFLEEEDLFLDLETLRYFGQQVTPKQSPIRFDTRFFIADLPRMQTPRPDNYEVDGAVWIAPSEAISAFQKGTMKIAEPTILSLETIRDYQQGKKLALPFQEKNQLL